MNDSDVITSIAGTSTPAGADLSAVVADLKPGQTVKVAVQRSNGTRSTLGVTLGEYPGSK